MRAWYVYFCLAALVAGTPASSYSNAATSGSYADTPTPAPTTTTTATTTTPAPTTTTTATTTTPEPANTTTTPEPANTTTTLAPSNATDNNVSPKYETATIVLGVLLGCALVAVSVVASCYKCIRRHHGHRNGEGLEMTSHHHHRQKPPTDGHDKAMPSSTDKDNNSRTLLF